MTRSTALDGIRTYSLNTSHVPHALWTRVPLQFGSGNGSVNATVATWVDFNRDTLWDAVLLSPVLDVRVASGSLTSSLAQDLRTAACCLPPMAVGTVGTVVAGDIDGRVSCGNITTIMVCLGPCHCPGCAEHCALPV